MDMQSVPTINPFPIVAPRSSKQSVAFLINFGSFPEPPEHNLDSTMYRAVALVREGLRRQDTPPQELARCACRLLGIESVETVARLATRAEDGCAVARRLLRLDESG